MSTRILTLVVLLLAVPLAGPARADAAKPAEKPATPQPLTKEQKEAAGLALKALRKLDAATDVGLNISQYGDRLIDTTAEVNEQCRKLPDGSVKSHLQEVLQTYKDAHHLWMEIIRWEFKPVLKMIPEDMAIVSQYKLLWRENEPTPEVSNAEKTVWFAVIWACAADKLTQVEREVG